MRRISLDEAERSYRTHPWTVTYQDNDPSHPDARGADGWDEWLESPRQPIPAPPSAEEIRRDQHHAETHRPLRLYDRQPDPAVDWPLALLHHVILLHCTPSDLYHYAPTPAWHYELHLLMDEYRETQERRSETIAQHRVAARW